MNPFTYQCWPTLFIFGENRSTVLLLKGREDPDEEGGLKLVSGQMHHGEISFVDCLRRIRNEELGEHCRLTLFSALSFNHLKTRRDGRRQIMAHYAATYLGGPVKLSERFSGHVWLPLTPSEKANLYGIDLFEMSQKLDIALRVAGPGDRIDI